MVLLILLLFVASLPTGSLAGVFLPARNLPALREARRSAYTGEPGGWKKLDTQNLAAKRISVIAAKQANVIPSHIIQAFYKDQQYGASYVSGQV